MKKKLISLLLVLGLVAGIFPAAFAAGEVGIDYAAVADKAAEHLAHLSVYYPELASEVAGDTQLGKQIFAYVLREGEVIRSDYCYIPVLRDGAIIALADYDLNGAGLVGMSISLVDGLNAYLAGNSDSFAILWDDRNPYLCTERDTIPLKDTADVVTRGAAPVVSTEGMNFNSIVTVTNLGETPEDMAVVVAEGQSMTRTTVSVTVPAKAQWSADQCWAACVASVGQQQTGKDYDSRTVARIMGRDSGGATAQETADALVSIYQVDAFVTACPGTSAVMEKLYAKKPLIFNAYTKNEEGKYFTAHAVVAYSFSGNPNGGTLGYMDPSGGVFSTITTSANGVFNFVWNGRLYETLLVDQIR